MNEEQLKRWNERKGTYLERLKIRKEKSDQLEEERNNEFNKKIAIGLKLHVSEYLKSIGQSERSLEYMGLIFQKCVFENNENGGFIARKEIPDIPLYEPVTMIQLYRSGEKFLSKK